MEIKIKLNERESVLIQDLSIKKDMTLEALTKQALRVYQTIEKKIENGETSWDEISKILNFPKPIGLSSFED